MTSSSGDRCAIRELMQVLHCAHVETYSGCRWLPWQPLRKHRRPDWIHSVTRGRRQADSAVSASQHRHGEGASHSRARTHARTHSRHHSPTESKTTPSLLPLPEKKHINVEEDISSFKKNL